MMDHKSWLWKKKSTEKTLVAADRGNISQSGNEEETLLTDKAQLERDLKILNEKLSTALSEINAKDDITNKQEKMAQEAIAGWEKAEAEALSLKQELDKALQQRVAGEERLIHLDAALKECMQQLRFVREEQEKRIHDAVMKTSREFENKRIVLEEKLAETSKRLAKLGIENSQLSKALLAKDKMIEELNEGRAQAEADFKALTIRLESTEKDNASLKYEVCVLEKELEIRNEEREFNHRTADVAHKHQLESMKKIAKLESECQRLRLLIRKRLPGPAALAKMKNEVEMLGRDPAETRRRKSNPFLTGSMDFSADSVSIPDTPSKRINFMTEQLCILEEENRTLKETLNKKINERQFSRIMFARTGSKLSQVEAQFEPARILPTQHELSLASMSDMGSDDKVSCAESWASALISESEHFRNGKRMGTPCKTVGASDINLMDDFLEMEKLAIVSVDKPLGSSHFASEENNVVGGSLENQSGGYSLEAAGGDVVPLSDCQSDVSVSNGEIQSKNTSTHKVPGWLDDILKVVLEQTRATHRNPDEILEDIKVALAHINLLSSCESIDARECSNNPDASDLSYVNSYVSQKPSIKSSMMDSSERLTGNNISLAEGSNQQLQSDLGKSLRKIIELIEGISLSSPDYNIPETFVKDDSFCPYKNSETPTGYMVRVFQWKTSELDAVLQKFIRTCNELLNGKADQEKFAEELTSSLEWLMNHCFSLQDVSSMREAIKKHFDWDESRSETEVEGGIISQFSEADKLHVSKEQLSYLPIVSAWNGHNNFSQMEELLSLKDKLANTESGKRDLEVRLQSEIGKSESMMIQLQESERRIESLQKEVETLKQSNQMIEAQIKNHKLVKEDFGAQLTLTSKELNEARQKCSSLQLDLENKNNLCEELEATCLDLQLQLESMTKNEIPKCDMEQEEKQLRTDWEITAASEKLAECQETILNLGKQLKALASPSEAALFDKVILTPTDSIPTTTTPKEYSHQRSSLLDKMLAEDSAETGDLRSPNTTLVEAKSFPSFGLNGAIDPSERFLDVNGVKHHDDQAVHHSLAIVPRKRKVGGGFLKNLLWRRKKGNNSKKKPFP